MALTPPLPPRATSRSSGIRLEVREAERPERFDPQEGTRILGVDPGFSLVGVALVVISATSVRCTHRERISTRPSDGDAGTRLDIIARRLHAVIARELPDAIGVENVSNVGHGKGESNSSSAEMLKVPGMLRALAVVYGGVPVFDIATATARVATLGKGNTRGRTKNDIVDAVQRICGLGRRPTQDEAEAVAVAFGAFRRYHSMR